MVWTWKLRVCFQVACKHSASISQTPVSDWYRTACGLWGIFQMLPPNRYRSVCLLFPQLFYAVFCSSYMSPLFLSPHCFHGEDVFSRSRCAGNSHSCLCLWWGLRAVTSSDSTQDIKLWKSSVDGAWTDATFGCNACAMCTFHPAVVVMSEFLNYQNISGMILCI